MPFIRGIIFSPRLLDGCKTLRDQLMILQWGGLHLAVLKAEAEDAAPAAAVPDGSTGGTSHYSCEGLSVLLLRRVEVILEGSNPMAVAAEAAAASWALNHGLEWPSEVLVLGTLEDEAGALHQRQQHLQQQQQDGEGATGGLLPGFALESLEQAMAADWQRLRLALAHANLRRAQEQEMAQEHAAKAADAVNGGGGSSQVSKGQCPGLGGSGSSRTLSRPSASVRSPLVVVGTAMKASRERDLAREGLLNLVPQDGVVFAPLDLSMPLEQQLPFHAILHKASDELEYGEDGTPRFGPRVRALADFVSRHPEVSLVDPLEAAVKVINRTELARVCDSLSLLDLSCSGLDSSPADTSLSGGRCVSDDVEEPITEGEGAHGAVDGNMPGAKRQRVEGGAPAAAAAVRAPPHVRVRAPRSTTVTGFSREEVEGARERLGCGPPYIVKPVVACGTPDSHRMALVLLPEALEGLKVPVPAVVQEFVNHNAAIFKVYVAGDKVFYTVRPSIPNVPHSRAAVLQLEPNGVILFDSLKSLPTTLQLPGSQTDSTAAVAVAVPAVQTPVVNAGIPTAGRPSQVVLERLSSHLRASLGLSLFGFDVVIAASANTHNNGDDVGGDRKDGGGGGELQPQSQPEQQELVVVDINYFPSYRGAEGAASLFRAAVLGVHIRQQQGQKESRE